MNFTPLNVGMFVVGVVLIYAAIKNLNPRDMIGNVLKGNPPEGPVGKKADKDKYKETEKDLLENRPYGYIVTSV